TDGEAARIERRLVDLGYMDAEADDAFDDYTRDALLLFQREAGLESTGVADRKTVDALFSGTVVCAEHCAPHEIASGDSGAAVRDVEDALMNAGYTTKLPNGKFDAALEKGLENAAAFLSKEDSASHLTSETVAAFQGGLLSDFISPDITRLQRRLYTLCYLDKGGVDGVMGENTVAALHEFQAANDLPQTDAADQPTLSVLFSADAAAKRYPYRVEVSIDRQEVEVWRLNRENQYDHVKTFTCSTGKNNTTPRGIFLNAFPQDRWHYFRKFLCWAQYSFVIEGDILFHSVIYGQRNENTVHRSSVRNLGNPASHGCVRLSVEDAKWLFEHCEKGKVVVVIR
ncbi:MAG: murein L,D-transpeptidase, partial [Clostridia bacterium]|nr:murein L,D-transpeptidase [Clostridia bacterium]